MKWLLFLTIFIACVMPIGAALYFADDALQRSLNLGFNPQIIRELRLASQNLKTLKLLDPVNQDKYRAQFNEIEALTGVYAEPQWIKASILGSLKIYFGLGIAAAALLSLTAAMLVGRRISRSYQATFKDLLAQRERVRYLEEMSSWQEMAKTLAHEIKNPLTPIEVLVTSLSKAYLSKTPQEFKEQLQQTQAMVGEEIGHLKRTVTRYSDFAKLPQAQLMDADLVQAIEQHLSVIRVKFGDAAFVLRKSDSALAPRVRIDSSLFRQVLNNIVSNGVEANLHRLVTFTIEVTDTREFVQVSMANDGESVAPDLASRIFDPYVSTKTGKDNMGLGLAIVKKIIVEHEGEIRYAEQDGHPVFLITLPRVS